jgi:hypothetical protein
VKIIGPKVFFFSLFTLLSSPPTPPI